MGPMVSAFDTYSMTEILYNIRLLLYVGDAFVILLTILAVMIVYKLYKKPKDPQ